MASIGGFKVTPYDGKGSFTLWQRRVKDILTQQKLARALKGKEGKPTKMSDEDWEDAESQCMSTIRLCIADNIINNVVDESTPKELWSKLETLYLGKNLTTKLNLKRELYKLKMAAQGNVIEHMNVFNGIVDQLEKVDVKLEEEDKALILLTSLPESFDHLVTTILYGKDTLKMEEVQSALLSNAGRKNQDGDKDGMTVLALRSQNNRGRGAVRGSTNSRGKSRYSEKGMQCFGCKEWGHIRLNCPLNKKNPDASLAVVTLDCEDVCTVFNRGTSSPGEWILDSGSSYHVCSEREHFDKFQDTKNETVSLADGSTCEIKGIGIVKIKMFDGIVRSLNGVRYVPKLRKNLISIGRLASEGYRCSVVGGAMNIKRGRVVRMKGELRGGIYRLISTWPERTGTSKIWLSRARGKSDLKDTAAVVLPSSLDDGAKTAGMDAWSKGFHDINE